MATATVASSARLRPLRLPRRVRQLGFAGQVLAQPEHGADLADAAVVGGRMRDEIKQLARELERRVAAERGVAAFGQALDLAFDLGQRLLERLGRFEGVLGAARRACRRRPRTAGVRARRR